ncbi:MAG: HAMP domain-containing histidine kinase [Clostridia bacterium]|nr:HAMP domain-containing histidine kinase [Clostridia bacterium]
MLKKLRRKIIWINVLLCGVLLLGIITAVCVNTYRMAHLDLENGLRAVLERNREEFSSLPYPREPVPPMHGWMLDSYTVVTTDREGNILQRTDRNFALTEEQLADAVRKVMESGQYQGSRKGLMYVARESRDGIRIAFADMSSVRAALWETIGISAALFGGGIAVIFCISLWLSALAVRPVESAWEKQKQFIADASHELKTPLTVILANTRILLSHPQQSVETQKQWISSTDEEAKNMRRMVEQMLELARADAHETPVLAQEVRLSELVEGCVLCFEPAAYEKNVTLECRLEPGLVLQSDEERLTQLCRLLLDNAVKYADRGSTVDVFLGRENRKTVLRVHNEGNSIPAQDLPHLFDRFYRTDKARGEGGFGLGLAIAQSTAQALGGIISAESTPETGTTFSVILPASAAAS